MFRHPLQRPNGLAVVVSCKESKDFWIAARWKANNASKSILTVDLGIVVYRLNQRLFGTRIDANMTLSTECTQTSSSIYGSILVASITMSRGDAEKVDIGTIYRK